MPRRKLNSDESIIEESPKTRVVRTRTKPNKLDSDEPVIEESPKTRAVRARNKPQVEPEPSLTNESRTWDNPTVKTLIEMFSTNGFNGSYAPLEKVFSRAESGFRYYIDLVQKNDDPSLPSHDAEKFEIDASFNRWIDILRDNNETLSLGTDIALIVEWLGKFEDHPKLESSGGVDYSAIYQCLASLLQGHIPKPLNPATASKLIQIFRKMMNQFERLDQMEDPEQKMFMTSIQMPKVVGPKDNKDRNEILRERRKTTWSEAEIRNRQRVTSSKMSDVKAFYHEQNGLNPFNFPTSFPNKDEST